MIELVSDTTPASIAVKRELSQKHAARFRRHFKESDGCWLWTGGKSGRGYGAFRIGAQTIGAHRISFEMHHRMLEPGEQACHSCDRPACVNPSHLWAGSSNDNTQDKIKKGRSRSAIGEDARHVLKEQQVLAIRASYVPLLVSMQSLANEYGVGLYTVWALIHRKTWRHI